MSNSSNNPFDPNSHEKGPWLYSGGAQPAPAYVPPSMTPPATPTPAPPPSPAPTATSPSVIPAAPSGASAVAPAPIAPAAKPEPPKSTVKKADDASLASIVDTIEAIIIALILALTFRAFIVEAFVIPTGSMAPTLLGAHFNVICPKCGYAFKRDGNPVFEYVQSDANRHIVASVGDHAELTDNRIVPTDRDAPGAPIICPNCQYPIDPGNLPQHLPSIDTFDVRTGTVHPVPFAWDNNGDRILVLKYLYAVLEPDRFDVIVFKEPMTAKDNFIKRLIGLPRETIEIVNGDVFVGAPGHAEPQDLLIARKPVHIQKDVWQLVYDNDFYPTDAGDPRTDGTTWRNPWSGAGDTSDNWSINGPRLEYSATGPGMIQFDVRDPYTFNILGYNNDVYTLRRNQRGEQGNTLVRVGDLRLETVWTPRDASGASITLTLGKPRNQYQVVWDSKGVDVQRYSPSTRLFTSVTKSAIPGPVAGRAYHVALDNVDHSVRFFIDGNLVVAQDNPWTAANALAELRDQAGELPVTLEKPEIRIRVGGAAQLGHLKVFRDLYYTPSQPGTPRTANAGEPLTLGPDEFFAMGDNSFMSLDGRMWDRVYPALDDLGTREGIVPRRYLLGKAFFVYWPAGFRITSDDSIPFVSNVPLVPNTGEMRLIR
jgi:signal peptidase I